MSTVGLSGGVNASSTNSSGKSTQTGQVTNYPKWTTANLMQFNSLLGDQLADPSIGSMAGTNAARAELGRTVAGEYLSPSSNPWFEQVVNSMTDSSNRSFDRNLNKIAGTVGRAGWSSTGKEIGAAGNLANAYASDLSGGVGRLGADLYNTERGRQLAATGDLANLDNASLQRALQLAEFLRSLERSVLETGKSTGGSSTVSGGGSLSIGV